MATQIVTTDASTDSALAPTAPKTNRTMWIAARANELLAAGWQNPANATKRASREWRNQSPQHQAAVKRNAQMAGARLQRMTELPTTDATWRTIEAQA